MFHSGVFAVLCSAITFGSFIAVVPLFYANEGDPLSIMIIRISVACAFFGLLCFIKRRQLSFPNNWKDRFLMMGYGTGIAMMGLSYLQSVSYIPVSLAVMVFFTWPIVTALIAPVLGRPLPGPRRCLALLGAFLCLLPAIGPQLEGANMIGVMWAAIASLSISIALHLAHAGTKQVPVLVLAFGGSAFAIMLMVPALLIVGFAFEFDFPASAWALVVLLSSFYLVGLGCQLLATSQGKPEFLAIFYNVEPIVTLIGAYVLLGERLGFWQYIACAGVILCLFLYKGLNARKA